MRDTATLLVGNRSDLTVSVIDASTCNGSNTSGCPQVAPPAVLVGTFPKSAGTGFSLVGRGMGIDQTTHRIFIPVTGDSGTVRINGDTCRADHIAGCGPMVVSDRMGGFPLTVAVDGSSGTVYVANTNDGTVSIFATGR